MNIASFTGVVIASRRPVNRSGRNRSLVAVERGADTRIDRIAQILHESRVAQRQVAFDRRLDRLDGARDKAGCSDTLKEHVAPEVVAAWPQRGERRLQARFQFDKTANRGRGALAHR